MQINILENIIEDINNKNILLNIHIDKIHKNTQKIFKNYNIKFKPINNN